MFEVSETLDCFTRRTGGSEALDAKRVMCACDMSRRLSAAGSVSDKVE